jgi:hypothetical protein
MKGVWKTAGQQRIFTAKHEDRSPVDVFTWEAPKALGKLSIPFGCVSGERPRRFYCLRY